LATERCRSTDALGEIDQAVGFSSKSHFNKEFLRVTGMAPSQYRMQHK
jgi:AraC-like DNA-binding protein